MPPLVTISREGSVSTETRRVAVTALAGLVVLALPGAIASSDVAGAALVDLGALPQCDVLETLCPDDDLEPRERHSPRPNVRVVCPAQFQHFWAGLFLERAPSRCDCPHGGWLA